MTLMLSGEVCEALAVAEPPPFPPEAMAPVALAVAFAWFCWPTPAMFPGLSTRTATFVLLGAF